MDVTISDGDTAFTGLDFYYGAKALEGTSEVVALTTQTILNGTLVRQIPSIEGIRATFKKSFVSSYGQRFLLQITGAEQLRVMKYLGEDGFFQIFTHYLGLAVGRDIPITKKVALSWHDKYIKDDVELIDRIKLPLLRIHKPIEAQGYKVTLNKRRSPILGFN